MRSFAVVASAVLALSGCLTGCTSSGSKAHGAPSARAAATEFVRAINAGDGKAAAAISCPGFAQEARGAATSGADAGISFTSTDFRTQGTSGTAALVQRVDVGTQSQTTTFTLVLAERSGLWLVCGRR